MLERMVDRRPIRRRRALTGKKLLLISFVIGIIYFLNVRYAVFRLRGVEILPGNAVPDAVIWEMIPQEAEEFWPFMLLGGSSYKRSVERFYPVEVSVQLVGWGRFAVFVEPLDVFATVSWNGMLWHLSESGRMWLTSLPINVQVKGVRYPDTPVLVWDAGLPIPIDPENQGGDVYRSSLAIEKIKGWYETLSKTNWRDDIYCLIAKKVEGRPVVHVLFGDDERITAEIILKEDTVNWLDLAAAMNEIFPNAEYKLPPGKIINATFADMKFTVTNKR